MSAIELVNRIVDETRGTDAHATARRLRAAILSELGLDRSMARLPDEAAIAGEIVGRALAIDTLRLRSAGRGDSRACLARQIAMYALFEATAMSHGAIGKGFDRDRTTVIYAIERVEALMAAGAEFRDQVKGIVATLRAALAVRARDVA
jgi:chromosomal replication initiation ATPase DnaA